MDKRLYFSLQIDCESTQSSIDDPDLGRRAVLGISDLLLKEGLKATYVVIPKDLQASGSVYKEMHDLGHEVGLHVHPSEEGWQEFLGVYGYDQQRQILEHGKRIFADIMGYLPHCFTPGYFSANDYTFSALVDAGFTHGSVSLPTRNLPQCACVWGNSPKYAHYAHPYNRCLSGSLDFIDIPVTCDTDSRMWGGTTPQDLRVELVDAKNHYYTMEKSIKDQMNSADKNHVTYVKALTHNIFDYSDPGNFRRETLLGIISALKELCERYELVLESARTADIASAHRSLHALTETIPGLELDVRGRGSWK